MYTGKSLFRNNCTQKIIIRNNYAGLREVHQTMSCDVEPGPYSSSRGTSRKAHLKMPFPASSLCILSQSNSLHWRRQKLNMHKSERKCFLIVTLAAAELWGLDAPQSRLSRWLCSACWRPSPCLLMAWLSTCTSSIFASGSLDRHRRWATLLLKTRTK